MKKLFSALMISILSLSSFNFALADDPTRAEFEITSDGEITAYYGGELVIIPEQIDGIQVSKIGRQTFFDLGISDAYLPEGLSVIGESAFEGSSIGTVDIPSTLSVIEERAFANCSNLYIVFTKFDENTTIAKDAFAGTERLLFYINCGVDVAEIDKKLQEAKGDRNYDISIRHVASEYDEQGNIVCGECGFIEPSTFDSLPFEDVPNDAWYYRYIQSAYSNRIISGKSETIFDPDATMTCAEAAKIAACVNSIFFEPIPEHSGDVWYQPYVDYCYEYGLIEKDIVFDWSKPITRGQMAYIFSHCDPFDDWYYDINDVPITDIPDVDDRTSYSPEILKLYNKGIMVGDENMNFFPEANIKRCEASAIIARVMDWTTRIELPKG